MWSFVYVRSPSRSAFLHGNHFNAGHYVQTFQKNSFIPAMLLGIIYLYHLVPLSVILISAGRQREHQICWFHFPACFSTDHGESWYGDEAVQVEQPDG